MRDSGHAGSRAEVHYGTLVRDEDQKRGFSNDTWSRQVGHICFFHSHCSMHWKQSWRDIVSVSVFFVFFNWTDFKFDSTLTFINKICILDFVFWADRWSTFKLFDCIIHHPFLSFVDQNTGSTWVELHWRFKTNSHCYTPHDKCTSYRTFWNTQNVYIFLQHVTLTIQHTDLKKSFSIFQHFSTIRVVWNRVYVIIY